MGKSKVFMFDNSDAEMQAAYEKARASFRWFWREMAWERRRIIPALDLACVKAPFTDGEHGEHMWMERIDFDGDEVSGILLNDPNWVQSVQKGDEHRLPLDEISDWMYSISGEVFGAYTVNLMRSRMGRAERREHDSAWASTSAIH